MKLQLSVFLTATLGVACAGTSGEPQSATAPSSTTPSAAPQSAAATPAPAAQKPAVAAPLPAEAPELSETWLVIVASKTDPAEVAPAVAAAAAVPGTKARTVLSTRFKNLMPCYTVGIADGFAVKKDAFALSKTLTAAGVDNYVKNAGKYVGPSAAIDGFCASLSDSAHATGDTRIAVLADGHAWIASDMSLPSDLELAPPKTTSKEYDVWIQPLPKLTSGDGAAWRLTEVATGKEERCQTVGAAMLTLGVPHWGTLSEGQIPTEPTCGAAAPYAELDCSPGDGDWLATPADSPAPTVFLAKGEDKAAVARISAELMAVPVWQDARDEEDKEPERTVTITRYEGGGKAWYLAEGTAMAGGPCGGDEINMRALYTVDGAHAGTRVGDFQEGHFSRTLGLIDSDGDGKPEILTREFPAVTLLSHIDGGEVTSETISYCDCPC